MSNQLSSTSLLVAVVACLLILGIVVGELPELVSLADNTSNDFVIRKAGRAECAPTLTVANHSSFLPEMKQFVRDTAHCAATSVGAELISSDLVLLHSVLRR